MILVSDNDSSVVGDPAESSLDCISSPVAIPEAVILSIDVAMVLSMGNKKIDSSLSQTLAGRVAVIGFVSDHSLRSGPWSSGSSSGDSDFSNNLIKERDLSRRGTVGIASERNTLAIDQYQALRSLSPLGFPDSRAPFFAGKKLASTKTSSQSRMPLWSNSERNARHMSLRTSSSYHSLRRRQQVEGFGYRSGRSFHLAPVLSTHSIPSNTSRSSVRGRPPFRPTVLFGMRGSILRHCSSVKYTTRLLTGLTSGEVNISKTFEKQTVKSIANSRAYKRMQVLQPALVAFRIQSPPSIVAGETQPECLRDLFSNGPYKFGSYITRTIRFVSFPLSVFPDAGNRLRLAKSREPHLDPRRQELR